MRLRNNYLTVIKSTALTLTCLPGGRQESKEDDFTLGNTINILLSMPSTYSGQIFFLHYVPLG